MFVWPSAAESSASSKGNLERQAIGQGARERHATNIMPTVLIARTASKALFFGRGSLTANSKNIQRGRAWKVHSIVHPIVHPRVHSRVHSKMKTNRRNQMKKNPVTAPGPRLT